ncbi:MAG: ExeM/NucH family extracellular endonuclease, partial [Ilumatobacteraceae bacterium]
IVTALAAMDAHVVGLVEIQNDAGASTADLVAALNAATPGRYAAIETGTIGSDAIKVALIYQPAMVTPVGLFRILTTAEDPRFIDTLNRPVLIQTFEEVSTGERLTVAVNHLKSKGSPCAGDTDPARRDDGQGNCAAVRTAAAMALADFLATDPTGSGDPDFLIVGDLNAYRREHAITALGEAGYVDLIEQFVGDDAYSYLFDGQLGYLDHALATPSLVPQVTGVTEWAINADEPVLFDYNDTIRDAGESSFERESIALPLYLPDERRSSDHNPLVVGLDLEGTPDVLTIDRAQITLNAGGGRLALEATVSGETFVDCPQLALAIDGTEVFRAATTPIRGTSGCRALGQQGQLTFDRSTGAIRVAIALPAGFQLADDSVRFDITLDDQVFPAEVIGQRRGGVWRYTP